MYQARTVQRIDRRVEQLKSHFIRCLKAYDERDLFTGPSMYFHHKTLARLRRLASAVDAVHDQQFLEYLYATLASWGLHRMGSGYTKLADFSTIRRSLIRSAPRIEELASLSISDFATLTVDQATDKVWQILQRLTVGVGKTLIVANSKALHHILPALVPPIDRQYTLAFFFHHTNVGDDGEAEFREIYPRFHAIARAKGVVIRRRLRSGISTSETKVIDDAIIGYAKCFRI